MNNKVTINGKAVDFDADIILIHSEILEQLACESIRDGWPGQRFCAAIDLLHIEFIELLREALRGDWTNQKFTAKYIESHKERFDFDGDFVVN
jgi:hypothetical protein